MARILVIDDEEAVRRMVRRALEMSGHEVDEANDGRTAMTLLEQRHPDLVITDMYMADMDGIEFTIRMSQLPHPPRLIAMSGGGFRSANDILETARRLGAARTLTKPFGSDDLRAAVAETLADAKDA